MDELPGATRIGRVCLDVADREGTASFYEGAVGLEPLDAGDACTTLGAGDTPLVELAAAPDVAARPRDAAGLFHVAYRVPDRQALAEALARIRDSGRLTGASDHLVSEALYLRDPEANGVEVYRDRPREEWDRPEQGRVRMDTLPLDLDDLATAAGGPGSTTGERDPRIVPPGTDVGHVHLEVTDLERARAFYVDALGFDVAARMQGALFVSAGGYHHHVGLNVWNGRSAPASGPGLDWFEVVVPTAAALDDAVARLDAAGHDPTRTSGGATVADPDGIEVRLAVER